MSDEEDMDKPVTKRQLHETFDVFLGAILARLDDVRRELTQHVSDVRTELTQHVSDELARHTRTVSDRHHSDLSVLDDKYKDLPPRIVRLETAVFSPGAPPIKRQRRR